MSSLMAQSQSYVDALLHDYAAGTLDESQSLIVAAYTTLSPQARAYTKMCETMCAALFENECDQVALAPSAFDAVMSQAETLPAACADSVCKEAYAWQGVMMPKVLKAYLEQNGGPFKTLYQGLEVSDVATKCKKSKTQMMRLAPRTSVPEHTHDGLEMTLVLHGAFHDQHGVYRRGDLIITDSQTHHHPIADEVEGCLCLVVTTAPVRFTGWVGRFLNPFIKH